MAPSSKPILSFTAFHAPISYGSSRMTGNSEVIGLGKSCRQPGSNADEKPFSVPIWLDAKERFHFVRRGTVLRRSCVIATQAGMISAI